MIFFRFTSYLWVILIVLLAVAKGIWLWFSTISENIQCPNFAKNNLPDLLCNNFLSVSIFLGIIIIILSTYMLSSYNKAYIYLQENYYMPTLYGITTIAAFTAGSFFPLLAIVLSAYAMLQFLSLSEDNKTRYFLIFDMGLILGLAILIDVNFIFMGILFLSFFLYFFDLSYKQILQYIAGLLLPFVFFFPYIYFNQQIPEWSKSFMQVFSINTNLHLHTKDYILIPILLLFAIIQTTRLLSKKKAKPKERSFILFLLFYFVVSLCLGIFKYPNYGLYTLFVMPPLYLLHNFARIERNYLLFMSFAAILLYSFL